MNAREALFLSLGINVALVAALVAVIVVLGSPNWALQERLIAQERTGIEERLAKAEAEARAQMETANAAGKALAEANAREALREALAKADAAQKKAAERMATDRMAAEKLAAAERAAQDRIAAAEKAAGEAQRKAIEAMEKARRQREMQREPSPGSSSGDSWFDQAQQLEKDGKGAEAVRTYTRAARSGSGKAAKRLGEIYDKGIPGVSRDYAESLKWYNTARALGEDIKDARRGDTSIEPQNYLPPSGERLYDQAAELERSGMADEALNAYRRAARSGNGKAANRLGEIYEKGAPGVDSNYAESLKWCNTARALGETPNCAVR